MGTPFDEIRARRRSQGGGAAPAAAPPSPASDPMEGIDTSGYAMPVVRVGALPAPEKVSEDAATTRRSANEAYFTGRHKQVMDSKRESVGPDGEITTLRTATVGGEGGEPGYIIPTYNPDTGETYDLNDPEQRAKAMKMVEPDIASGKLQPYERWQDAESDLKDFYPRATGYRPTRTGFDEIRERNAGTHRPATADQRAQTHQAPDAGMVAPPGASPIRMTQPSVSGVRAAMEQAQTARPGRAADIPADNPQTTGPQLDQTMLAPKGEREASARILGAGARAGIEFAGAKGAGSLLGRVAPKAGPLLKAGATAVGSAAGSLLAEPLDPSEDPLAVAGYSLAFSGFGDAIALGVSGAAKAVRANAATRGDRLVEGGRRAVELLGDGNLPTAGRLTTSPTIDTLENVAEKSIGGSRLVQAKNETSRLKAESLIREEIEKYAQGASRVDIDQLVASVLNESNEAYRAAGDALYRELDGLYQQGVSADGLIRLRNSIVSEFRTSAEATDLEALVQAIDTTLGVPPSQRGIRRGFMLDPNVRPRKWDPNKPGPVVIEGADPSAQLMQPEGFVTDPMTGLPVRGSQAQTPSSAPVVTEGAGADAGGMPAPKRRFTTDPKTGELVEAPPEAAAQGSTTQGRAPAAPEAPSVRITQQNGGYIEGTPNSRSRMTFEEMNRLRSAMLKVGRSGNELMPGVREGQAKRVAAAADDALTAVGAEISDPRAFEAWRNANAFWKSLGDTFNDNVMRALANARPDDLFNTIMRADSPQQITKFRQMLFGGLGTDAADVETIRRRANDALRSESSSPAQKALARQRLAMADQAEKTWRGFQGRFFMRLLEHSTTQLDSGARTLSGSKLMGGWESFGADSVEAVFPDPAARRRARDLFRTLEIVQSGTGTDTAKMAVQFGQAGAGMALILRPTVRSAAQAVVIFGGPEVLAKLVTNERFIHWVITSKNAKAGSETFARSVAQMMAIAAKEGARVVGPNGERIELTEDVPKAREARETLGVANRRGGYR